MPINGLWPIQTLIYDALTGHAPLTSLLHSGDQSIFDHVPDNTKFPYVVINGRQARDESTKSFSATRLTFDITCYARENGTKNLKAVMSAATDAINTASLSHDDFDIIYVRLLSADIVRQNDNRTQSGVMQVEIMAEAKNQ